VHTLDNSPRAIAYFDDVSRPDGWAEDYFSGRGAKPGRWVGSGLSNVGLTAGEEVDQESLHRALFSGEHPVTGDPLGQRIRRGDGIAGFGMTFSAPKSVSLLWALGSPEVAEKVEAAEAAAVDAGIGYLWG
jgi:conjugative relaxase-like TrwC/TraI family protein